MIKIIKRTNLVYIFNSMRSQCFPGKEKTETSRTKAPSVMNLDPTGIQSSIKRPTVIAFETLTPKSLQYNKQFNYRIKT